MNKLKKILMNRKPVDGPWGGGNHWFRAMCKYAPKFGYEIVHVFSDDLSGILMADPRYDDLGISVNEIVKFKTYKPNIKIIHRVNECDARKGESINGEMDCLLRDCSQYTDVTVFVSEWMKDYHSLIGWKSERKEIVINGVDQKIFLPLENKLNNKINIVVHHWADNFYKNVFTKQIDEFVGKNKEDFSFTFIGRVSCLDLPNTNILPAMHGNQLAEELAKHNVYISSSIYDPGPNHILESISCGLPTYAYSNGGGGAEFVGLSHTYKDWNDLEKILLSKKFEKNNTTLNSWEKCAGLYFRLFE